MDGGANDLVARQATQPPYSLVEEGRKLAGSGTACLRPYLAQSGGFRIESKKIQPMGFSGRREATSAPTVGYVRASRAKSMLRRRGPSSLAGIGGVSRLSSHVNPRRATYNTHIDQASQAAERRFMPPTPWIGLSLPLLSQHHSTALPSLKRYD